MNELLTLDNSQQEVEPTLNLSDEVVNQPILPQFVVSNRAMKYDAALGKDSPGRDSITSSIISGKESLLREYATTKSHIEDLTLRRDLISQYAVQRPGGDLQPGEREFLNTLSTSQLSSPRNVLEKKWGDYVVNATMAEDANGHIVEAEDVAPDALDIAASAASSRIGKLEYARKVREELQAQVGWVDWGKNFIPFYSWYNTTNVAPDSVRSESFLKGSSVGDQVSDIWQKSDEDFFNIVDDIKERTLKGELNPENASEFLGAVEAYTSNDKFWGNVQSYVDLTDLIPGIGISGSVLAASGKGTLKFGSKVASKKATKEAIKQTIKDAEAGVSSNEMNNLYYSAKKSPVWQGSDSGIDSFGREIVDPETGNIDIVDIPNTPENRAANVIDAAVENAVRNELDPSAINATNGNLEDAALDLIVESWMKKGSEEEILARDLVKSLSGFFNPKRRLTGATTWATRAKEEFLSGLANSRNSGLRALFEGVQAQRITRDQLEAALPVLKEEMRRAVKTPDSAVIDVKWGVEHESVNSVGVNYIDMGVGKTDGTLFKRVEGADDAAVNLYGLEPGSYKIMGQGGGYYIKVRKPVEEVSPKFRDLIVDGDHTAPIRTHSLWTRFLVSGETFQSEASKGARRVATHQVSKIHQAMYEAAQDIGQISKGESRNLEMILEMNRDTEFFKGTKEYQRGFWYDNIGSFEQGYKTMFNERPSEKVTRAYFTYRNLMDTDFIARNLKLYREKSRMGIVGFTFAIPMERLVKGVSEKTMQMSGKRIEGKIVDDIIQDGTDKRILLIDNDNIDSRYIRSKTDGMATVFDYQEKGYKLIQIANPDQRPLMSLTDNDNLIQYALVKNFDTYPLDYMQIPYTQGGHVVVSTNWKVSQSRIVITSDGTKLHVGDRHFGFFSSQKEATMWSERMETARKMMVQGDFKSLGKYITEKNLPYKSVNEFLSLFEPKLGKDGKVVEEPTFLKDIPFIQVADREGTNDAAKTYAKDQLGSFFSGVVDTMDMPENLYRLIDKKFAGAKNELALTVEKQGADWGFTKARHLSPLETMNDSISNVMRNTALDNYQTQAVESFIQQFSDVMLTPKELLRQDPLEHLLNPDWNTRADPVRLASAKANRLSTIQFLGLRNPTASSLDWVKDKLLNSVYDTFGKGGADWADDHMLPYITDPSSYIRSVAFHLKLGLFNPVQLFLQSQGMFHAMALTGNPARVASSLAATTLMMFGRMTRRPEVINKLAKISTKLGWKEAEFKEMWDTARSQGLHIVGGEYGDMDNIFSPKVFNGAFGKFLDKGTIFFRESEKMVRLNAWAIAYKEFRKVNPNKVLDADAVTSIMKRQDDLSVNMTRASNAAWQQGIFSIPTQFSSYQARLTEQLLGKVLTKAEKARVIGMYSALYGLPVTAGAVTLYPFGDDIRREALSRGINLNEGATGLLVNGMLATALEAITDTQFNVGQRMGPGGLTLIRDFLQGDKTTLEILAGPSGTITADVVQRLLPAVSDLFTLDINSLKQVDFMNAFQEISTVSNTTKLLYALRAGKLISKEGTPLGPMNTQEAWIMALTGLTPQRIADAYLMLSELKSIRASEQEMNKQFQLYIRKAYQLPPNSPERKALVKKAYTFMLDRDPNDAHRMIMEIIKDSDLTENVEKQFGKGGPVSTREDRKKLISEKQK